MRGNPLNIANDKTHISSQVMSNYFHFLSVPSLPFQFFSFPFISFPVRPVPSLSFQFLSFPLMPFPFLLFPFRYTYVLSFPLISFPFLSCPFISSQERGGKRRRTTDRKKTHFSFGVSYPPGGLTGRMKLSLQVAPPE